MIPFAWSNAIVESNTQEQGVRHSGNAGVAGGNSLEHANRVVRQITDRAPRERRLTFFPAKSGPHDAPGDDAKRIAVVESRPLRALALDGDFPVPERDSRFRRRAEERVPGDVSPSLDALEEKRFRSRGEQLSHHGDGRRRVREQRPRDDARHRAPRRRRVDLFVRNPIRAEERRLSDGLTREDLPAVGRVAAALPRLADERRLSREPVDEIDHGRSPREQRSGKGDRIVLERPEGGRVDEHVRFHAGKIAHGDRVRAESVRYRVDPPQVATGQEYGAAGLSGRVGRGPRRPAVAEHDDGAPRETAAGKDLEHRFRVGVPSEVTRRVLGCVEPDERVRGSRPRDGVVLVDRFHDRLERRLERARDRQPRGKEIDRRESFEIAPQDAPARSSVRSRQGKVEKRKTAPAEERVVDEGRERPRNIGAVDPEDSRRRIRTADAVDVEEVGDGDLPVRRRSSDAAVSQRGPEPGADDPGERAARPGREAGERPRSGVAFQGGKTGRAVGNRPRVRPHELDRGDVRRKVAGHFRLRPAALAGRMPRPDDAPAVRKEAAIVQRRALQLDVDGGPGVVGRLDGSAVLVEGPAELPPFALAAVGHDRAARVELQQRPRGDAAGREIQPILDRVRPLGDERNEPFRVGEIRRSDRRDDGGTGKLPFQNSKPPDRPGVSIQSAFSIAPPEFLRQGEMRPTELPRYTNTSWAKGRTSSNGNSSGAFVALSRSYRAPQPATIARKAGGQDAEIRD